jgi:(4S)-4-hydroxy-5-phosphonooxypentane-2,3-dione isomerase
MNKTIRAISLAGVLALAGAAVLQLSVREAAAQGAGLFINAVDLDINPADMPKFMEAIKENGAASVKESGCRTFNIHVSAKDPNHVFLYEVYDNAAALDAHRQTAHFKKYAATTKDMVVKRDVRPMTAVALNSKGH